ASTAISKAAWRRPSGASGSTRAASATCSSRTTRRWAPRRARCSRPSTWWTRDGFDGKAHVEGGLAGIGGDQVDASSEHVRHALHEVEPEAQAGSAGATARLALLKHVEDARPVLGRDPRAGVAHAQPKLARGSGLGRDPHLAGGRELERVREEVPEDRLDLRGVHEDRHVRDVAAQLDSRPAQHVELAAQLVAEAGERDRRRRDTVLARVEARDVQDVVDEVAKAERAFAQPRDEI